MPSGSFPTFGRENQAGQRLAAPSIPAGDSFVIGRTLPWKDSSFVMSGILIEDPNVIGSSQRRIPCLSVGIEPEISVINEDAPPELVNAHVDIVLTTTIEIEVENGVYYRYRDGGNICAPDTMHASLSTIHKTSNPSRMNVATTDMQLQGNHHLNRNISLSVPDYTNGSNTWPVNPRPARAIEDTAPMENIKERFAEMKKHEKEMEAEKDGDKAIAKERAFNYRHHKRLRSSTKTTTVKPDPNAKDW